MVDLLLHGVVGFGKSRLGLIATFDGIWSFNFHFLGERLAILDDSDLHIVRHFLVGLVLGLLCRKTLLLHFELVGLSLAKLQVQVGGRLHVVMIGRLHSISRSWICGVGTHDFLGVKSLVKLHHGGSLSLRR